MKTILWLLSFMMMYAVDPNDGGGAELPAEGEAAPAEGESEGEGEGEGEGEPQETMLDAVTAELERMAPKDDKVEDKSKTVAAVADVADVKGAPKEPDLTMPQGLSPKAQERFTELANTVRDRGIELQKFQEKEAQYTHQIETHNQFIGALKGVGIEAPQMTMFMNYVGCVQKGDYETAHRFLTAELDEVSKLMGKPLPGSDPLRGHDDLRESVDDLRMTEEAAIELARHRDNDRRQQGQMQQQNRQQQQVQYEEGRKQQGLATLDGFVQKKSSSDIDYKAKEVIIMRKGSDGQSPLDKIITRLPPEQWASQVELLYENITIQKAQSRTPTPLRTQGPKMGDKAPTSMLEAINAGLGY